jgi:hypothetical protein
VFSTVVNPTCKVGVFFFHQKCEPDSLLVYNPQEDFQLVLLSEVGYIYVADIITEMYLSEIKAYRPAVQQKVDIPTTFKAPAPPAKPVLEMAPEVVTEAALAEEAWPELENPIDNPNNYNGTVILYR